MCGFIAATAVHSIDPCPANSLQRREYCNHDSADIDVRKNTGVGCDPAKLVTVEGSAPLAFFLGVGAA